MKCFAKGEGRVYLASRFQAGQSQQQLYCVCGQRWERKRKTWKQAPKCLSPFYSVQIPCPLSSATRKMVCAVFTPQAIHLENFSQTCPEICLSGDPSQSTINANHQIHYSFGVVWPFKSFFSSMIQIIHPVVLVYVHQGGSLLFYLTFNYPLTAFNFSLSASEVHQYWLAIII